MGRYTGANCKLCRRRGEKLYLKGERCHTTKCSVTRRPYAPGAQGPNKRPKKKSDYAVRLNEKQKARRYYGIGEKQFRIFFAKASKQKGMTGTNFVKLLECRFDNFVYRLGLTESRAQSRQMIRHGHFKINDHKVNIPSYTLKVNDVVTIIDKSTHLFAKSKEIIAKKKGDSWYSFDIAKNKGQFIRVPERDEIDAPIEEQLIVEFYSR